MPTQLSSSAERNALPNWREGHERRERLRPSAEAFALPHYLPTANRCASNVGKTCLDDLQLRIVHVVRNSKQLHPPSVAVDDGVGSPWIAVARLTDRSRVDEIFRPFDELNVSLVGSRRSRRCPEPLRGQLENGRAMRVCRTSTAAWRDALSARAASSSSKR